MTDEETRYMKEILKEYPCCRFKGLVEKALDEIEQLKEQLRLRDLLIDDLQRRFRELCYQRTIMPKDSEQ